MPRRANPAAAIIAGVFSIILVIGLLNVAGIVPLATLTTGNFNPAQWSLTATAPSSAAIVNGVLNETVVDTAGSYTGSFFATAQYLGRNGYTGPPIPITAFTTHVNVVKLTTLSTYLWHPYVGLYYLLAAPVTAGGITSNAIDGQVQVEQCANNIAGGCNPAGYTYTSGFTGANARFGYREIQAAGPNTLSYDYINYDVNLFCARALAAWGIPSQPCSLVRLELGAEGYGVNPFNLQWTTFAVSSASTCSNGAVNPPSCNICPTGQVLQNGVCVNPSGDFTITANPSTVTGTGVGASTIMLAALAGFTGVATLTATPSSGMQLSCAFTQTQILVPGSGTLTCQLLANATASANGLVIVSAISGSLQHQTAVTFQLALPGTGGAPTNLPVIGLVLIGVGALGIVAVLPFGARRRARVRS